MKRSAVSPFTKFGAATSPKRAKSGTTTQQVPEKNVHKVIMVLQSSTCVIGRMVKNLTTTRVISTTSEQGSISRKILDTYNGHYTVDASGIMFKDTSCHPTGDELEAYKWIQSILMDGDETETDEKDEKEKGPPSILLFSTDFMESEENGSTPFIEPCRMMFVTMYT